MEKVKNSLSVSVPAKSFVDEGDGVVSFPKGLIITDNTPQRNGTTYDIDSLDISHYDGQLTGDHEGKLGSLIGRVEGIRKLNGQVVVDKIVYAVKENPYARLAYNLLVGGFSKNFSTETFGPKPDINSNIFWNAELTSLSQVVTQNNYNAHINKLGEVVHNSLEQSKQDGFDVSGIEEIVLKDTVKEENKMEENKKEETLAVEEVKQDESTKVTPPAVTETEETTEVVKTDVEASEPVGEVQEDEIKKAEETKIETPAPKEEVKVEETKEEVKVETPVETPAPTETPVETPTEEAKVENKTDKKEPKMEDNTSKALTAEQVAEIVANALKPMQEEVTAAREEAKNAFDASAKEPEFKKEDEVAKNDFSELDWEQLYQKQIDTAWNAVKLNDVASWQTLREINQVNLDGLKKAGIAKNSITLDDLGNFVIPEEMYREIAGHRNDYTAILDATEWRETLSLEFAWLERVGDIDMQPVAIGSSLVDANGPVSDDARLKPISEYSAIPRRSELEELAAVTVVATSTTRFAAVDLLADAAQGYRTDYDRKRAQLVIAKLEGAVDQTGYSVAYAPSSDVDALTTWLDAVTQISDTTLNGTLIFNARTFAELKSRALSAGVSGPLSSIFLDGEVPTVFGYRYIVVPNDLMPSLGGGETIVHTVNGVDKRINHAVFFAELSTFTGRTSGGLQYDVSNSASYEANGVVKSAYQRNELVLRGSFFRGGAVKDREVVAGIRQSNGANLS